MVSIRNTTLSHMSTSQIGKSISAQGQLPSISTLSITKQFKWTQFSLVVEEVFIAPDDDGESTILHLFHIQI